MSSKENFFEATRSFLASKNEILFAFIHGSFLESADFHDIDIAVYLDEEYFRSMDVVDYEIALSLQLEDHLRTGIPCAGARLDRAASTAAGAPGFARGSASAGLTAPIDMKILNGAPLSFRYAVSCGRLLFGKDQRALEEFLTSTWRDYFDFKPVANIGKSTTQKCSSSFEMTCKT
jgi:predicted nucleotidyltransferase